MEGLILLWVVCGAAAASMAKTKGRKPLNWVIIGLVIGPFALLILGMLKATAKGDQDYDS